MRDSGSTARPDAQHFRHARAISGTDWSLSLDDVCRFSFNRSNKGKKFLRSAELQVLQYGTYQPRTSRMCFTETPVPIVRLQPGHTTRVVAFSNQMRMFSNFMKYSRSTSVRQPRYSRQHFRRSLWSDVVTP